MKDKRIFQRVECIAMVKYTEAGKEKQQNAIAVKNVSGGGMQLSVLDKFSNGTVLNLEIHVLKAPNIIPVKGKVLWVKDSNIVHDTGNKVYDIGIEFINADLLSIGRISYVREEE